MDQLMVAVCEDRVDDEERIVSAINNSSIPARVALFSEAPAFVEDYIPGTFDLILMDIYLERLNGEEGPEGVAAVRSVRAVDPVVPIAFVTSSKDHALDAYRLDVARYLEKPVTQEAVDDILRLAERARSTQPGIQVRVGSQTVNVAAGRIVFLEQQGHYMDVHLSNGEVLRARGRLSDALEQLDPEQFVSCHKSYVANLNYVNDVDAQMSALKMYGGKTAPVRRGSLVSVRRSWEDWLFQMARRKVEAMGEGER